jgi:hypothetical protein
MPHISEFFGIVIRMFNNDHSPPHFHAQYGDYEAVYLIKTMEKLVRISSVIPLEGFDCQIIFEDGKQKVINLEPYLHGPIYQPILVDENIFRSVRVIEGAIGWENGADIDPDVLYYDLKPAWMEETIND